MARASVFETQPVFAPGLSSWLARNRAWDIEYGGFRTNHLSHNWVAMAAADAADEQMQWWLDLYCGDLEQPHARNVTAHPEPARRIEADWPSITPTTWADHLSDSRELYPAYLEYFDREIAEHGRAEVIERHVPALLHGIAGAALHPVIHAGFGS